MGEICIKGEKTEYPKSEGNKLDNLSKKNEIERINENKIKQFPSNHDEHRFLISHYDSHYDIVFSELEETFNLLLYLDLHEFVFLLNNFNKQTTQTFLVISTNKNKDDKILQPKLSTEELNFEKYRQFIKNKIINNPLINPNNKIISDLFSLFMDNLYKSTYECLLLLKKIKNKDRDFSFENIKFDYQTSEMNIEKIYIAAIGFNYCLSTVKNKIIMLFTLFDTGNKTIERSENFFNFIYLVVALSSYIGLDVVRDSGNLHSKLTKIKDMDFYLISAKYAKSKVFKLATYFVNELFKHYSQFDEILFFKIMLHEDFNWILCPKGVRSKLDDRKKSVYGNKVYNI